LEINKKNNIKMKIDRVLLASNENINYYPFWNPLSKIYKENFGIKPTLIWFGEENDIERLNLSREYGEIIIQKPNENYPVAWQTTYAPFYYTKFFKNEIVTTIGIDQVPLSSMFLIDMIKDIDDEQYVTLIDDAYLPIYWSNPNGTSPSAYHIGKGETFDKIYNFEETFILEVEKIYNMKVERDYDPNDAFWASKEEVWGMDESYTSKKLREYKKNNGKITCFSNFQKLKERRIECYRTMETPYNDDLLLNGWYSESHLCRPYTDHVEYINRMFSLIPKYI